MRPNFKTSHHLPFTFNLDRVYFTFLIARLLIFTRLKDERNIDDLLSFIEGPCANEKKEKKKKAKKGLK